MTSGKVAKKKREAAPKGVDRKNEPEILVITESTMSELNIIQLKQSLVNMEMRDALQRDLIDKLDPEHNYVYDGRKRGFTKINRGEA